jgi:hypothetical protein
MADTPAHSPGIDGRTLERVRDTLEVLSPDIRLERAGWSQVAGRLERLEAVLSAGDADGAKAIVRQLEEVLGRLRTVKIGAAGERDEEPLPMPEPILLRRNRLIHDLDWRVEDVGARDSTADE